ncbi:MAG: hypothetical protein ACRDYZ_16140 [Acidimicrobiales bacterium]
MWIAIAVPVMVLALAIAVLPAVLGSVRSHRWQHRRLEAGKGGRRPIRQRTDCPLCGVVVEQDPTLSPKEA